MVWNDEERSGGKMTRGKDEKRFGTVAQGYN
jgi:hypothetical protein